MTTSKTENAIDNEKPVTDQMIIDDLKNGLTICLYFATEDQVDRLIDNGDIDEDYSSVFQDYQEELRILINVC
jgi:hypothetical protein